MLPSYYVVVSESISLTSFDNVFYVFPLKDFAVGFTSVYSISDINVSHAYLYLNRLLDTKDIAILEDILFCLPTNIEGIIFEDLGVYELVKSMSLKKILYAVHANCNYMTINTYLDWVDRVVISPDITLLETKEIISKVKKPVIVYGLGHLSFMYSRRTLNTNYAKHFNYASKNVLNLKETMSKMPFLSVENDYGTVIYDDKLYLANKLVNEVNIDGVFINSFATGLDTLELIDVWLGKKIIPSSSGFLEQKTIVNLKEE